MQWKAQLLDGAAGLFGSESRGDSQGPAVDLTVLHAKIGELTLENDFLAGALGKAGLLSAKRLSTARMICRSPDRPGLLFGVQKLGSPALSIANSLPPTTFQP